MASSSHHYHPVPPGAHHHGVTIDPNAPPASEPLSEEKIATQAFIKTLRVSGYRVVIIVMDEEEKWCLWLIAVAMPVICRTYLILVMALIVEPGCCFCCSSFLLHTTITTNTIENHRPLTLSSSLLLVHQCSRDSEPTV